MCTTFLAEGHHPHQGDKQKKTFLSCGVLPSRQHLWWAIYIRGRCPRLLMVVPSRHQSACGIQSVVGYYPEDRMFILVYRLAMDAKTRKGDGGAD